MAKGYWAASGKFLKGIEKPLGNAQITTTTIQNVYLHFTVFLTVLSIYSLYKEQVLITKNTGFLKTETSFSIQYFD
jgi:hypothetical protein